MVGKFSDVRELVVLIEMNNVNTYPHVKNVYIHIFFKKYVDTYM